MSHSAVEERPVFLGMVQGLDDLVVGRCYIRHSCSDNQTHRQTAIEIVAPPEDDKVRVKFQDGGETNFWLSDLGLQPYSNGKWSHYGHLEEL